MTVLRSDLSLFGEEMKDGPGNEHLSYPGLASDPLDLTLTFYAVKSLDIPLSDMGSSTPSKPVAVLLCAHCCVVVEWNLSIKTTQGTGQLWQCVSIVVYR